MNELFQFFACSRARPDSMEGGDAPVAAKEAAAGGERDEEEARRGEKEDEAAAGSSAGGREATAAPSSSSSAADPSPKAEGKSPKQKKSKRRSRSSSKKGRRSSSGDLAEKRGAMTDRGGERPHMLRKKSASSGALTERLQRTPSGILRRSQTDRTLERSDSELRRVRFSGLGESSSDSD